MSMGTALRQQIWDITNGRCFYCRSHLLDDEVRDELQCPPYTPERSARIQFWQMHVDHRTPTRRGGSDKIENLTPACGFCNMQKNKRTVEEYRDYLFSLGVCPQFFGEKPRDWLSVATPPSSRTGFPLPAKRSGPETHPHVRRVAQVVWPPPWA